MTVALRNQISAAIAAATTSMMDRFMFRPAAAPAQPSLWTGQTLFGPLRKGVRWGSIFGNRTLTPRNQGVKKLFVLNETARQSRRTAAAALGQDGSCIQEHACEAQRTAHVCEAQRTVHACEVQRTVHACEAQRTEPTCEAQRTVLFPSDLVEQNSKRRAQQLCDALAAREQLKESKMPELGK